MSGGDVQDTLNELERKLRELQAELSPAPPAAEPTLEGPPPMPPYRPPVPSPAPPPAPAGGLQDQLDELLRFRDQLTDAATKLVEDYSRILEQLSRATADVPDVPDAAPPPTPAAGHATFPVPPPTIPSTESTLFSGPVTIAAGPFEDVTALAQFEQALRAVPHAESVSVRKLKDQRAVIDLELASDVPLVFELRRASERTFDVDHAEPGRLELTIHGGDLPFPMRP
jgi:hypothetical protein